MPRRWIALILAVGMTTVLTSCTDDHNDTVARSSSSSPSASATSTSVSTTTVPPDGTGPQDFVLPSGNIGCAVGPGDARCDIRDKQWQAPPDTMDCPLDYGDSIVLE